MKFSLVTGLLCAALVLAGCNHKGGTSAQESKSANNDEAIHTAILAHLAHRGNLDMKAFDTQVKQITYDGDHAKAQVEFHVKKGPGVMQLTYALAKTNNAWAVVESKPLGSDFSHPPLDKNAKPAIAGQMSGSTISPSSSNSLDQRFRSDIGTPPQAMPPGHPPVNPSPQGNSPQ